MRSYLVTGGAGFIGSHLVEALIASGASVVVLDDLSTGRHENLPAAADLVVGSILDTALLAKVSQNVDGVFHLAAVSSVQKCREEWTSTSAVNHLGAVSVFEAARRRRIPVVYASSAAVYGVARLPASETHTPRPISSYGVDKYTNEVNAQMAHHMYDLSSIGLRFFNVFGPRQSPLSPYSGVISKFVDAIQSGRTIRIFGDGQQTRDFIYVADVVKGLQAAMTLASSSGGAHIFNLCRGLETTILNLALTIGEVWERELQITYCPPQPGDIRHSRGDPTQARDILKFEATWSLIAGLREMKTEASKGSMELAATG